MDKVKEKVCLICIDGWGIASEDKADGDAIRKAATPNMTKLSKEYPYTTLSAHGLAVGLPEGLMGNSEVGHLNIGAGRVVYQDIVRLGLSIKNRKFSQVENIKKAFNRAKEGNGRIHFLGLVSDGGVHSHIDHLIHILECARDANVPQAYVQFFGDGRDTSPRSADKYYSQLKQAIDEIGYGKIATIIGRYYAMDRDKRWERIKTAFDGLVHGTGERSIDPLKTIQERYAKNETDEFLKPIIIEEEGRIRDGDTLFFFDFRADRMRQIVMTFGIPPPPIEGIDVPKDLHILCLTQYKADFPFDVAFPTQSMANVLAEWLAKHKIPQCHVAETEKYAHVTFFFNGGVEKTYDLEDRELLQSPRVSTYDLQPEMAVKEVGDKVAEKVASGKYPFVMCNLASPDMVGHTGIIDATVTAVNATDKAIGVMYEACQKNGYVLFITADHGNAEQMLDASGKPHTAHTCNPVPFIMASKNHEFVDDSKAALCDVAPTILDIMGLDVPPEMSGVSRLKK